MIISFRSKSTPFAYVMKLCHKHRVLGQNLIYLFLMIIYSNEGANLKK